MKFRYLGNSGLKVSEICYGNWLTHGSQVENEVATRCVETALEEVYDSNGQVGGIVYHLGDLHHKACAMARPEPTELAERLFRLEMTLPFSLCSFDANAYRDVLGKAGLRRYRELAEAEWGKVKPHDSKDHYDVSRARITRVPEQPATASGNP